MSEKKVPTKTYHAGRIRMRLFAEYNEVCIDMPADGMDELWMTTVELEMLTKILHDYSSGGRRPKSFNEPIKGKRVDYVVYDDPAFEPGAMVPGQLHPISWNPVMGYEPRAEPMDPDLGALGKNAPSIYTQQHRIAIPSDPAITAADTALRDMLGIVMDQGAAAAVTNSPGPFWTFEENKHGFKVASFDGIWVVVAAPPVTPRELGLFFLNYAHDRGWYFDCDGKQWDATTWVEEYQKKRTLPDEVLKALPDSEPRGKSMVARAKAGALNEPDFVKFLDAALKGTSISPSARKAVLRQQMIQLANVMAKQSPVPSKAQRIVGLDPGGFVLWNDPPPVPAKRPPGPPTYGSHRDRKGRWKCCNAHGGHTLRCPKRSEFDRWQEAHE